MSRLALAASALALLVAGPAAAALPPEAHIAARAKARHHLQLRVTSVEAAKGVCRIKGRVAKSFRGGLPASRPVAFTLACLTGDVRPVAGPTVWFLPKGLQAAKVMEGFFDEADGALHPARDQVAVVPAVRERPWCATTSLSCQEP